MTFNPSYLDQDLADEFQTQLQAMDEQGTYEFKNLSNYIRVFADLKADQLGCSEDEVVKFLKSEWSVD